jgi:hypothetical protein
MKRNLTNILWALFLATLAAVTASAQTSDNLGDYARQVRKQKAQAAPAVKKFDNDNLPAVDKLSVVGEPSAPAADAPPDKTETADAATGDKVVAKPEQVGAAAQPAKDAALEKQKDNEAWQKKIKGAQDQIDLMTRELDVMNREYRLRAAAFYADAGNRLRNSGSWDKDDAQYKEQIAVKQQAIEDAKKSLDDLQEQARKAGVPSSMRE